MFWPRRTAGDDRSPYGSFWFEPIGSRSLSGLRVGGDAAMKLGAVFRCVSVLANTFPVLPFGLFTTSASGVRVPQKTHWLYQLIAKRPNEFQNPFEWRQMCMGHIALRGNAYNRIYSNSKGEVTDLIPLHPDRMKIDVFSNGNYRYLYQEQDGSTTILPRGQIWHLRGMSSDGILGISPLRYGIDAFGGALAAQEWGALFFRNAGGPTGGWIELPGKFKDKTDRENFKESWQNERTGENRHKAPILENGMKFHELAVRNDEAQFLETRKFSVTDICRFFGVPPHLAYDLDRSTNNNIEQQALEFSLYTLTPIAEMWEASIRYEFLQDEDELEPQFDMRRLLRGDMTARSNFYKSMFSMGSYSPNDILTKEGENPVEGGDQRFVPVNMAVLKPDMESTGTGPADTGDDPLAPTKPPPKPPAKGPPAEEKPQGRAVALAQAAAERIARRETAVMQLAWKAGPDAVAKAYEGHARFVAAALAIPLEAAEAYCAQRKAESTGSIELCDYETISRCRLERLAVEGTL